MPELPEVETARRGIAPHITGKVILEVVFRTDKLRFPLDLRLTESLPGQAVSAVERRAKYLLLRCSHGTVIIHLGMSGVLRILPAGTTEKKHDHVDLIFQDGTCLRFSDPRKFGLFTFTENQACEHKLLRDLGPEPLSEAFSGHYLYQHSRNRKMAVKSLIMDQRIVVGVGNIYANEALFLSGIHPGRNAGRIGAERYKRLAAAIKKVLSEAIASGGTTINDFLQSDGRPGYFKQSLAVYGRSQERCTACDGIIRSVRIGQRSTFFCPNCQR